MSPAHRGPVVVGIDDAGSSRDAVEWASAEAAARGCALRLVHAFHPSLPADPYGLIPAVDGLRTARAGAEALLADAVARARSVAFDLEVSALPVVGSPVRTLLHEAAGAGLLVLGTRGPRGRWGPAARSVSVRVAARAPCPVAVIGAARGAAESPWAPARVVVGVDGAATCVPVVGFAFQAARLRGIPLVVVHAWTPDPPADLEGVCDPPANAEALARRTLRHAVERRHPEFPDVPVHTVLVRGDPERALLAQSRGAALLVLGTRGRAHLLGAALGSVGRTVLRHGHCPLAIVRHPDAHPLPSPRSMQDRGSRRRPT